MPVPKLYPENVYGNPPTEFDETVAQLAETVQEAVKGFGTDENSLIAQLGDEPSDMRVKLYHCYKKKFGEDIREVMKSELGNGNLGTCMQVR
jgi:hypothetical protein